jgi:hypothetical protein
MEPRIEVSNQTTTGYHGTTLDAATQILENSFELPPPDTHSFLGEGVYFFDGQPSQAKRWASEHRAQTGDKIAVIKSDIRYGRVLNLTDKEQSDYLKLFACEYQMKARARVTLAAIIDIAAEKLRVHVVKAMRIPKNPDWIMNTAFSSDVEIILAVRDISNILSKEMVWNGLAGYRR